MSGLAAGTRVAIEQAIARGLPDEKIVTSLMVEPRVVRLVRAYLEAVNDEDDVLSEREAKRLLGEETA